MYNYSALPLFVIHESGKLTVCTAEDEIEFKPGQILISVADPRKKDKRTTETSKAPEGKQKTDS
jgi:hypothetical protein